MMRARSSLRPMLLLIATVTATAIAPGTARATNCSSPGDDAAVAAFVADVRAACPCDGFRRRGTFRRCVRDRIQATVADGTFPARCRARVVRMANRSTCGDVSSAVTCCAPPSLRGQECRITRSVVECEAWRGGAGRVGSSDWCHDACPPSPSATPSPTPIVTPSGPPTPTRAPSGLGPRCVCVCGPPQPQRTPSSGCLGAEPCIVMSFVPSGAAECDALDDGAVRNCTYDPGAPRPGPVWGPYLSDCTF